MSPLRRGDLAWVDLGPSQEGGTRPGLVVASDGYLESVPDLVILLPVTTVDRSWPHHVLLRGSDLRLPQASFAMTEQPRTVSRGRISRGAGAVDAATMADVDLWLRDFISL